MPTTPKGLPYPDGTGKVGQLPAQLQALAEAVDAKLDAAGVWVDLVLPSGISQRAGADYTPQILRDGNRRELRGQFLKNFTAQTVLVDLPDADKPSHEHPIVTVITGTTTTVPMWVRGTTGEVVCPAQATSGSSTYYLNIATTYTI